VNVLTIFQEMGAEFYHNGGEVEGEFRMNNPHMDSPLMMTPMTDKNYAVIRMKYYGLHPTAVGSFYFRSGNKLPPASYAKVSWGPLTELGGSNDRMCGFPASG
jgi:hypothetical protein